MRSHTLLMRCAARHCMEAAAVPVVVVRDVDQLRVHLNRAGWGLQQVRITSPTSIGQGEHHLAPLCPRCWKAVQSQWEGRINV